MARSLFRPEAQRHIENAEALDAYARTLRPGAWISLIACLLLLVGALVYVGCAYPEILHYFYN